MKLVERPLRDSAEGEVAKALVKEKKHTYKMGRGWSCEELVDPGSYTSSLHVSSPPHFLGVQSLLSTSKEGRPRFGRPGILLLPYFSLKYFLRF